MWDKVKSYNTLKKTFYVMSDFDQLKEVLIFQGTLLQ